jgi:hypothetical protein
MLPLPNVVSGPVSFTIHQNAFKRNFIVMGDNHVTPEKGTTCDGYLDNVYELFEVWISESRKKNRRLDFFLEVSDDAQMSVSPDDVMTLVSNRLRDEYQNDSIVYIHSSDIRVWTNGPIQLDTSLRTTQMLMSRAGIEKDVDRWDVIKLRYEQMYSTIEKELRDTKAIEFYDTELDIYRKVWSKLADVMKSMLTDPDLNLLHVSRTRSTVTRKHLRLLDFNCRTVWRSDCNRVWKQLKRLNDRERDLLTTWGRDRIVDLLKQHVVYAYNNPGIHQRPDFIVYSNMLVAITDVYTIARSLKYPTENVIIFVGEAHANNINQFLASNSVSTQAAKNYENMERCLETAPLRMVLKWPYIKLVNNIPMKRIYEAVIKWLSLFVNREKFGNLLEWKKTVENEVVIETAHSFNESKPALDETKWNEIMNNLGLMTESIGIDTRHDGIYRYYVNRTGVMQIYRNLARYFALMWYKQFEEDPDGLIGDINSNRIDTYSIDVVDLLAEFEVIKTHLEV